MHDSSGSKGSAGRLTAAEAEVIADRMIADLRREREAGKSQPELIAAGRHVLEQRFRGRPNISPETRYVLLSQVNDAIIARLPAANTSSDPYGEGWLIQAAAEIIDQVRGPPL